MTWHARLKSTQPKQSTQSELKSTLTPDETLFLSLLPIHLFVLHFFLLIGDVLFLFPYKITQV